MSRRSQYNHQKAILKRFKRLSLNREVLMPMAVELGLERKDAHKLSTLELRRYINTNNKK
jgi:hypothetical protein